MSLLEHAKSEMRAAGLYDKDSDYNGMLGTAVEELVAVFAKQRHSGFSAHQTMKIFSIVANFKTLVPLTGSPYEWLDVSDMCGYRMFQNRRQSSCFSTDGGVTYYDIDERQAWWRRILPRKFPMRLRFKHRRT